MANQHEKVVVAMSGGVDSSVAACLLKEQGYDVVGLFMRVGGPESKTVEMNASDDLPLPHPDVCPLPIPAFRDGSDLPQRYAPGSDLAGKLPTLFSSNTTHTCGTKNPGQCDSDESVRSHQGCCSASDAGDARFVAGMLGIPFYALNFEAQFDELIGYFADEYVRGRTPNPCVVCNHKLKFGKVLDYANAIGAEYIATGHYAQVVRRNGSAHLMRGRDPVKDQSYVLFGLDCRVLDRVLFPIGGLLKSEVRELANRWNLPNRDKPDSVEICFVPDRDYARVVRQRRPEAFAEGDVFDQEGKVIGRHKGVGHYTIGQRRGLGIAAGKPIFVTQINADRNEVVMGDATALLAPGLIASDVNFLLEQYAQASNFRAEVKIRYLHKPVPASIEMIDASTVRVTFDEPQRAVTPGQAVVFYDGNIVIGGGWIERTTQSS